VPVTGALPHAQVDLIAAMLEFDRDQPASDSDVGASLVGFPLLVGEDEAGAFRAGVDA
jgi:hypothetical protein